MARMLLLYSLVGIIAGMGAMCFQWLLVAAKDAPNDILGVITRGEFLATDDRRFIEAQEQAR